MVNKNMRDWTMIKKYKEGYRKVPESIEEIKVLTKMSAKAFAEDAWSDRDQREKILDKQKKNR
ncbi:MAG: hypothetical protein HZA28_09085 [Candidatus Omnitrophica bacterium]|nr:hypothetical protein [Candidatus Omnitrophota bacterium]